VAVEGPGHDRDVDEEFARIVAGWDDVATTSGSAALPPVPGLPQAPDGALEADASTSPADEPAADDEPTADEPTTDEPAATAGPAEPPEASTQPTNGSADDIPAGVGTAYEQETDPDAAPWRGYLPDEPDEHFEPPEPQLPPAHDATYWLAVVGLVAGPLLVLWAVVLSGDPDPGWLIVAGLLLTIGGFGLLIMRGSGERDPDDDGSRV
jgi:hypothetical protein